MNSGKISRENDMLLRIILLPIVLLSSDIFPFAMAHYKSVGKCIKHWVIDGCRDIKSN
jgi:hypothetical protein